MVQAVLMPAIARPALDRKGLETQPVLLSVPTDVALDGEAQTEWLIVTPDHLSVVHSFGDGDVLRTIPWDEVDEVRTVTGVGSGRVQVRSDEIWTDLLRYSNSLAQRFHKVSRSLDQAAQADSIDAESFAGISNEKLDPPHCESCGLRLPIGADLAADSCPRCMQQGRIVRRVFELIAPYRNGAVTLCLLTIVGVAAELVPPKLQQYMVDHILARDGASGWRCCCGERLSHGIVSRRPGAGRFTGDA